MNNPLKAFSEMATGWIPFLFALALCYLVVPDASAGTRSWEPAFYSFLPMCFFFAGLCFHLMRREIRELREEIARLQAAGPA